MNESTADIMNIIDGMIKQMDNMTERLNVINDIINEMREEIDRYNNPSMYVKGDIDSIDEEDCGCDK